MPNVYYKITYPSNLKALITDFSSPRYSQGWYGTCLAAKPAVQIDTYNDADGYCLAQFPVGAQALPSGMQDGAGLTVMTQADYNALLATLVSQTTDGSNGIWTGTILANRTWGGAIG